MSLCFETLSLRHGDRLALDQVSGALAPGELTVILGPNGAGKSSLLACLAGLAIPDTGTVRLDDIALPALDPRDRARRIGLLPQRPELHWDLSVEALVGLGRLPHLGRWGRFGEADHGAVARAMEAADVMHLADRAVTRLSGGEQGRVLLARVLAGEPRWLLADEPLASLDPAHQLDTLERLRGWASCGAGVVVVLHDLSLAARYADRVLLMADGRLLADGPTEAVMTPALLGAAYGVAVEIGRTATGALNVLPVARL